MTCCGLTIRTRLMTCVGRAGQDVADVPAQIVVGLPQLLLHVLERRLHHGVGRG